MNKKTIEKIKKELLAREKQIIKDLNNVVQKNKGEESKLRVKFPDIGNKTDENVLEIGEYSTNIVTEKVLENALRDIKNALDRIKKGTYGVCKYCGKGIGEQRMLARPVASACVECKSKLQKSS